MRHEILSGAERLLTAALESGEAYRTLAHLTDEIGPRLSGSKNAHAAVLWTTERLASWGLNPRTEPVIVPHWERGGESARLVSHRGQHLVLTTLGNSVATPSAGITAEVIEATSFEELEAEGKDRVAGKIVFLNGVMDADLIRRGNVLDAYFRAVELRVHGADRASQLGAVAVVVRSVGSASLRTPHTGSVVYEGVVPKIPAAALSAEDAMLIHRLLAAGESVHMHLQLSPSMLGEVESANVIAEIPGSQHPGEIVLIGAHLDSWDLGTGAIDNGSGVAMVMETIRLIHFLELRPSRTVRAVLFMNEENGSRGAARYAADHREERHVAAIECDSGCDTPRGFLTTLKGEARAALERRMQLLERVGAARFETSARTGADTLPLVNMGVTGFALHPEQSRYFDYHHSAADTLDKIDPELLAQNAAAVAVLAYALACE